MNEGNKILDKANELEGILRQYLNCQYNDFGVKANDNLARDDWKSPIYFALGYKYACSRNDENVKEKIDDFIGNILIGRSIEDIVDNYEFYNFSSEEDAYNHIAEIINQIKDILN